MEVADRLNPLEQTRQAGYRVGYNEALRPRCAAAAFITIGPHEKRRTARLHPSECRSSSHAVRRNTRGAYVVVEFEGYRPIIAATAFVAPTAVLVGNVTVGDEASIWYGAVLRADHGEQGIVIGPRSNVQDNCVLHVSNNRGTIVGSDVTVGHGALLEGCEIAAGAVIGMNAVVLEGAHIGARSLIAAGSTVLAGTQIPDDTMAAGLPAVVKKATTGATRWWIEHSAAHYVERARRYLAQGLDSGE